MTTKEYKDYILEQIEPIGGITCKPMMGEYLLYRNGKLFGGIYDNRFLVKRTEKNALRGMPEEIPYPSAKPMYMVVDAEDVDAVRAIIEDSIF